MFEIRRLRTQLFWAIVAASVACAAAGLRWPAWRWPLVVLLPLTALGIWDLTQRRHSLLRNYPLIGHLRFLIEGTGAELRQYIVESNTEGRPFNRDQRSLVYQRAKNVIDKKPFGTELDVYDQHYAWLAHSMAPRPVVENPTEAFRLRVGGPQCRLPYDASIYNISAMSFGALSAAAIRALNAGARKGRFAHNTGEGGLSRHHAEPGGDLIWQIGTGYFGCRRQDGCFDPDLFAEQARGENVRMIEIKISQGAKPGHGGILPGCKVTPEIAAARRLPPWQTVVSPPYHREFDTPVGLLEFVARLRELSGGKPTGFKLCVGRPEEFLGVCKAIVETGILPDFVTVDGTEGGTGAAPIEFSNHVGMPLKDGVIFVHNALVGIGVRDKVRVIASGKLISAFDIACALALGADLCNSARGFMFALGCIQAQTCHTNECPVGVATQDRRLQRALDVADKSERVYRFHRNTVHALAEVVAAIGLEHPNELRPEHVYQRVSPTQVHHYGELYQHLRPGELLAGGVAGEIGRCWQHASATSFHPMREMVPGS